MAAPLTTWLRQLGPLRWLLLAVVITVVVLAPPAGAPAVYSGWPLVRTVLMPVLAPLLFMLLLLDALMARVFMADTEGDARRRLRGIVAMNLVVALLLVLYWLPYYIALRPPTY